jgi:hemin uptake protein HemP
MKGRERSIRPGAAETGSPVAGTGTGTPIRRIRSEDLFGDAEEVLIEHNGRIYFLSRGLAGGLVLRA